MQKTKLTALVALFVICLTSFSAAIGTCAASDDWTLVAERDIKAYPELKETVWQKVPIMLPNGPFDKIGLHRLVKEGIEPVGVLLMLPGTWSNGEQLISNPSGDPWTKDEAHTQAIYWANRGFDVYAIDYRTHFVPIYLNTSQLSFMAEWGWDQWISDIKEAVNKVKEVSGAKRIYLAGESFGGVAAMNYASKYWEEDLKGLILLDPGAIGLRGVLGTKNPSPTNDYDLPVAIAAMNAMSAWGTELSGPGVIFVYQYADAYPDAPAPYPYNNTFSNITAYLAYGIYMAWGPGGVSNIYGGYGNPRVMIHTLATMDRYWPTRLGLETTAYYNWSNCPYLAYDFDEHYAEIDVPIIVFQSQFFGLLNYGVCKHGIANPDFTAVPLLNYGHMDVYSGEYSMMDVSAPVYAWMISHKMLVGLGGIRVFGKWFCSKAAIYINATTVNSKIDGVRLSWTIVYHKIYNFMRYYIEFYKGLGELGCISILITGENKVGIATGPRFFFIGQML